MKNGLIPPSPSRIENSCKDDLAIRLYGNFIKKCFTQALAVYYDMRHYFTSQCDNAGGQQPETARVDGLLQFGRIECSDRDRERKTEERKLSVFRARKRKSELKLNREQLEPKNK